jgi:hypothetical protein
VGFVRRHVCVVRQASVVNAARVHPGCEISRFRSGAGGANENWQGYSGVIVKDIGLEMREKRWEPVGYAPYSENQCSWERVTHRGSLFTFVVAAALAHTAECTPALGVFPTAYSYHRDHL